jgi:hypothetical protein
MPTKKPSIPFSAEVIRIAAQGASAGANDQEIIDLIGCHPRTYYSWLSSKPELREAVQEARKPSTQAADLARLQKRKQDAEQWLDDYFSSRGEVNEFCLADGRGSYTKTRSGGCPDMRLLDRILGVQQDQEFKLTISVAEPEPDDEEFED